MERFEPFKAFKSFKWSLEPFTVITLAGSKMRSLRRFSISLKPLLASATKILLYRSKIPKRQPRYAPRNGSCTKHYENNGVEFLSEFCERKDEPLNRTAIMAPQTIIARIRPEVDARSRAPGNDADESQNCTQP
jgi:hypothetical protein